MNDPTPSPPDPDSTLTAPVEEKAAPASAVPTRNGLAVMRKYWWLPIITLTLSLVVAAGCLWCLPPTFVSSARMWETVKLRLPEGAMFLEDNQNFLGTQTALLQSDTLRTLALARLRSSSTNMVLPPGEDRLPLPVIIRVVGGSKSSVFMIEATSANQAYTQAFLNALMNVYLEYKRNIRNLVSGDTLASIVEQLQRAERDLKHEQDILMSFQLTNNLAILQDQGTVAVDCLARLNTQLSDLQLEDMLLNTPELSPADTASRQTLHLKMEHIRNSIKEWESKVMAANTRRVEAEHLRLNVQRIQSVYDRLLTLVQNVGISRNIDQETLSILEPASPANRSYAREKRLLKAAGFGGLGFGLGILILMELCGAVQRHPLKPKPRVGQDEHKPNVAGRLDQIKVLHERGLLSKEAYDQKVKQIIAPL